MIHELKILNRYANAILSGEKTFEIRENRDRGFQKGDFVNFVPIHDKDKLQVAGHPILDKTYEITFVLNGFGMPSDYVAFSIKEFPRRIERLESEDLY